ncbi:MAG: GNAT family N-acetyltransferase [Gemmatimonadaceae bacterium]
MPPPAEDVTVRRAATHAEYAEVVAIQRETWGADFTEVVPPAILMVAQKIGGVTAAAFAPDGRMLGFVFGLAGVKDGRAVHWSDMLAVRREARGLGIGPRLKAYQRELALAAGATRMYWTYDPLVARNAHVNLVKLGARAVEYVPDMYGASTGSVLHEGIGTDRLVVEWELQGGRGPRSVGREPVLVEIPSDVESLLASDPGEARAWRERTRAAFTRHLADGYAVTGLVERDGRVFYELSRP